MKTNESIWSNDVENSGSVPVQRKRSTAKSARTDGEKKYRYFYHYFKQKGKGSVHFRGKCTVVDKIIDKAESESHDRKTQPKWVMRGFGQVEIKKTKDGLTAIIT